MWFPRCLLSRAGRRRSRSAAPRTYCPWLQLLEPRDLPSGTSAATEQLQAAYGQLPLSFEANQGQTDPQVRFLSRGSGYALFLTSTEAVLTLQKPSALTSAQPPAVVGDVLTMRLVGANPNPAVAGLDRQEGTSNYLIGNNPSQWDTGLGGNNTHNGLGIAVDGAGSAYVTGWTQSNNFPTTLGAFRTTNGGGQDAFVTKRNATGTALFYSTYLGRSGNDLGQEIAVDGNGIRIHPIKQSSCWRGVTAISLCRHGHSM
jgi:hypothetical protein